MQIPKGPLYMSTKYFLDQTKIEHFKVKYRFWQFVIKTSWCREINVQQGKHPPNQYSLFLLFCFTCVHLFTFKAFCNIFRLELFNVPKNFEPTVFVSL